MFKLEIHIQHNYNKKLNFFNYRLFINLTKFSKVLILYIYQNPKSSQNNLDFGKPLQNQYKFKLLKINI